MSYVGNLLVDPDGSKGPLVMRGKFGTGTAIEKGEMLELTGNTNTEYVPMDSDYDMGDGTSCMAFAWEDIASGDRAGYYKICVPRPGDVFSMPLAAAGATAVGTALYWSSSKAVTVTTGTNIIGNAVGQDHYPQFQGHLTKDAGPDMGTTIKSQSSVLFTVQPSNSLWGIFQTT
jgi:predicted RecA/RadA family phage recombinase